jgi:hypothetical protein
MMIFFEDQFTSSVPIVLDLPPADRFGYPDTSCLSIYGNGKFFIQYCFYLFFCLYT